MRRSIAVVIAFSAAAACGGDSTGPGPGTITVVSLGDQRDTARALAGTITIGLEAGGEVRFQALAPGGAYTGTVRLKKPAEAVYDGTALDTAAPNGTAEAQLQFGNTAGIARLQVSLPAFGLADTVEYEILPGNATAMMLAPRDTALFVGGTFTLRASVTDQNGNVRNDVLTYTSSGHTIAANTSISAGSVGRSIIQVTTGTLVDTVRVSVVPQGRFAALTPQSLQFAQGTAQTMNLDGSLRVTIANSAGSNHYLHWSQVPNSLDLLRHNSLEGRVQILAATGVVTRLVPAAAGFTDESFARMTRSGNYVYFHGNKGAPAAQGFIWRIAPNGTGLDSVPVGSGTQPSASSDGSQVAYVAGGQVRVYTYGAGTDVPLAAGQAPHFSPDNQWIAFVRGNTGNGPIALVRPDNPADTVSLAWAGNFNVGFDWSPDSQWIIAYDQNRDPLFLISVTSQTLLPLAYAHKFYDPTFDP